MLETLKALRTIAVLVVIVASSVAISQDKQSKGSISIVPDPMGLGSADTFKVTVSIKNSSTENFYIGTRFGTGSGRGMPFESFYWEFWVGNFGFWVLGLGFGDGHQTHGRL